MKKKWKRTVTGWLTFPVLRNIWNDQLFSFLNRSSLCRASTVTGAIFKWFEWVPVSLMQQPFINKLPSVLGAESCVQQTASMRERQIESYKESSGRLGERSDSLCPVQFVWLLKADFPHVIIRAKPCGAVQHELSISRATDWRAAWGHLASIRYQR